MSSRQNIQDGLGRVEFVPGRGVLQACGAAAPTNGAAGFAPACIYQNFAGVNGTFFYVNIGTVTSATWVDLDAYAITNVSRARVATALATVGAGTITAAGIYGGVTTRGGAQSGSAFTDTTDIAANIVTAIGANAVIGQSFGWEYINQTNAPATITGGTGVTVSGVTVVPANGWANFLVTYTAANTFTIVGVETGLNSTLPAAQYTTGALQSATFPAGALTGASFTCYDNTGTTPATLTTRSAAQLFGDTPNAQVGQSYMLAIRNSSGSANTLTVGAGSNVTLTGTMTIAQTVTRLFVVTFNTATTLTIQSMGISAAGA